MSFAASFSYISSNSSEFLSNLTGIIYLLQQNINPASNGGIYRTYPNLLTSDHIIKTRQQIKHTNGTDAINIT